MAKYWIGFGCKRNTSLSVIEEGINQLLIKCDLQLSLIIGIATIDRKLQEPTLINYCQTHNLKLIGFNDLTLSTGKVPHPSSKIQSLINTYSVAESAALLAANNDQLLIEKQIFKLPNHTGIITLAIAKHQNIDHI